MKRHAAGYLAPWGPLAKLVASAITLDEALDRLDALPSPTDDEDAPPSAALTSPRS